MANPRWLTSVTSPSRGQANAIWPKAFTRNHIVRLSGLAQSPQVNKATFIRQDIPSFKLRTFQCSYHVLWKGRVSSSYCGLLPSRQYASPLHVTSHLTFTITLWPSFYSPHFLGVKTQKKKKIIGRRIRIWIPGNLPSKFNFISKKEALLIIMKWVTIPTYIFICRNF